MKEMRVSKGKVVMFVSDFFSPYTLGALAAEMLFHDVLNKSEDLFTAPWTLAKHFNQRHEEPLSSGLPVGGQATYQARQNVWKCRFGLAGEVLSNK